MSPKNKADIIRELFAAYHRRDREALEGLFADDFRFTSPYDDRIDKAQYFTKCWPPGDQIAGHVLERIFVEGDEAFVTYECEMKDGQTFRNTEFFTFAGDRVEAINVYFGATYRDGTFVKQT